MLMGGLPEAQFNQFLMGPPPAHAFENPTVLGNGFVRFFGEATSASSYGGYGGNDQGTDIASFKYWYDVPDSWKADIVTKQEKGYLGIDSRFSDPKQKYSKAYVITFPGYVKLKEDKEEIMSDLALADAELQDAINLASDFSFTQRKDPDGQVFVDYDIVAEPLSVLCTVTIYNKRLFALLAWSSSTNFDANRTKLTKIRDSLQTVKQSPEDLLKQLSLIRGAATCTMGEC